MHLPVAAVPEHLRVRPAPVEPDHDLRAGPGGLLQLRQRLGEGGGQAGRLAGHEAHRAAVMGGDVGVGTSFLRLAALVVPALGHGLGAGVGDEVVIDVVDPGQDRVGGQHRGGEQALYRNGVGVIGDGGQPGPDGPQVRQRRQPGQRPGIGRGQVLELLQGRRAQREAPADRRQQRHVGGLPARRRGQDLPGPGPAAEGVQQHRARIPGHDLAGDARPGRRILTGPAASVPVAAAPGVPAGPGSGAPSLPGPGRGSRLRRLRHARPGSAASC